MAAAGARGPWGLDGPREGCKWRPSHRHPGRSPAAPRARDYPQGQGGKHVFCVSVVGQAGRPRRRVPSCLGLRAEMYLGLAAVGKAPLQGGSWQRALEARGPAGLWPVRWANAQWEARPGARALQRRQAPAAGRRRGGRRGGSGLQRRLGGAARFPGAPGAPPGPRGGRRPPPRSLRTQARGGPRSPGHSRPDGAGASRGRRGPAAPRGRAAGASRRVPVREAELLSRPVVLAPPSTRPRAGPAPPPDYDSQKAARRGARR